MPDLELIAAVYQESQRALSTLAELQAALKNGKIKAIDVAVVSRSPEGIATVTDPADVGAGRGSLFGAVVGAIVGLLGGPAGAVAGAVAGAATGGIVAQATDLGFEEGFLDQVKAVIQPGTSTLLVLVEQRYAAAVGLLIGGQGVRVLRDVLRADVAKKFTSG